MFNLKRISCLFLSILFIMSLTACGNSKPKPSEKAISIATSVLDVTDDYLDNNVTASYARESVEYYYSEMSYAEELNWSDPDHNIMLDISYLSTYIMLDGYDSDRESYDDVIKYRNKLAEDARLKKR